MNGIGESNISVIAPISEAIDRCKLILFKPFDMGKWFAIGFCAWLATLLKQYGSFNFHPPIDRNAGMQIGNYIQTHLTLIISIVLAGIIAWVIIILVFLWLSSRGRFMFLHCVARNKAEVKLPWRQYHYHGNSLFIFRLLLGLTAFVSIAVIICTMVVPIVLMRHNPNKIAIIIIAAVGVPIILILSMVFALTGKFTREFVIPIMYLRNCSCVTAWKEFLGLFRTNTGKFVLFLLFHIVIGMAIATIVLAAACLTCCVAACLMAVPYIGTVVLLPVLVFSRNYSLYYLRQYGQNFDVFSPVTTNE
jgi:hypothetical protein